MSGLGRQARQGKRLTGSTEAGEEEEEEREGGWRCKGF